MENQNKRSCVCYTIANAPLMAWEIRKGNRYYYRKRRKHGRVVSEYVGNGETAALLAQFENLHRNERQDARETERTRRREFERAEQQIKELSELAQLMVRATLLVQGYHTHKRQWRRRRDRRE